MERRTRPSDRDRLLARLPDEPRWTETRSAILAGDGAIYGSERSCVVRDDFLRLLSVVGRPPERQLRAALAGASGEWTLICPLEDGRRWGGLLPGWSLERAILHTLRAGEPRVDTPPAARVERVEAPAPGLLEHLPDRLRREVGVVVGRRPLFAAWVDGKAVSFCYAGSLTESWWDVSVDTLAAYRRRGLAAACFFAAWAALEREGRQPVWGAVESNVASLGLAAQLGFEPVDELAVLWGEAIRG